MKRCGQRILLASARVEAIRRSLIRHGAFGVFAARVIVGLPVSFTRAKKREVSW